MTSRLFAVLASAAAVACLGLAGPASGAPSAAASTTHSTSPHAAAGDSDAFVAALADLRAQYATTHLRSVHNAIILILNNPSSAVV